jgi:hypothetical protein
MDALLFFEAKYGPVGAGKPFYGSYPTTNHLVAEIGFNGSSLARSCVLAPGITRSRLS